MSIRAERVYEAKKRPKAENEYRILVDRIWPRGVKKEELNLDDWAKEIAPSTSLRKWFDHDPQKWNEFEQKYRAELQAHEQKIEKMRKLAKQKQVVLLYAAREQEYNQAKFLVTELRSQ